jgi:hypothetical protein
MASTLRSKARQDALLIRDDLVAFVDGGMSGIGVVMNGLEQCESHDSMNIGRRNDAM